MNPYAHSILSVRRRGGRIEDYYPIHDFMDCTKELCSDNRHRILHTLWGVRRVVVPIFGSHLVNSDGRSVSVKDLCEQDHILPDYGNKFIPTLEDFVAALSDVDPAESRKIDRIHSENDFTAEERDLLLSPLFATGKISSLLITHNSWFLNSILPRVLPSPADIRIKDYEISAGAFFTRLSFLRWMDNGEGTPPSYTGLVQVLPRRYRNEICG